jgi:hypothetical protein
MITLRRLEVTSSGDLVVLSTAEIDSVAVTDDVPFAKDTAGCRSGSVRP